MCPMYRSLLSALLLGLFPSSQGLSTDIVALQRVSIAPVSEQITIAEEVSASGIVIYDVNTGQKLYAKQERIQRPMASLTKLMTALVIAEEHDMNELVTVPQSVADVTGNRAYLTPGKKYSVGDLLSALIINSANDAALTLAQFHSGSASAFVATMNERALTLGMTGTSFTNPAGLDNPAHWSTPQDIAWLTMHSMNNPDINKRLGRAGQRIESTDGDEVIQLYHTHMLLHETGPVMAGKTGTTSDAGECLVSIVEYGDASYLVVLLNSNQRYKDMETILAAMDKSAVPVAVYNTHE